MPAMDIFNDDGFSCQSMTAKVNKEPFRPGQIGALGVFEEDGVTTTIVSVEERNGKLSLIEPSERGGPGETTDDEDRNLIPFEIDHYQRDDAIKADEVQNVRAFGTEGDLETVDNRVMTKLRRHLGDLDMTLEHQRVGAIKGIVTSKSGKVLHNLYDRFGIAVPAPVSLELDVDTTEVDKVIKNDVIFSLEDDLDVPYTGIHAMCGRDFITALWAHKRVRETFLNHVGAETLRGVMPDKFDFGGITWERYKTGAKATADAGGSPYIANDEARLIVTGVPELFITRFAPADYEETVNTIGLPRYANQYPMPNNKGRNLEVQSNPISICTQPKALRRLTLT